MITRDADGLGLSRCRAGESCTACLALKTAVAGVVEKLTETILADWGVTLQVCFVCVTIRADMDVCQVPSDWPACLEDPSMSEVRITVISRTTEQVIDEKVYNVYWKLLPQGG